MPSVEPETATSPHPSTTVFACTLCGECCRGDQKVWLNPADLARLAVHLNLPDPGILETRRIVVREPGEHGAHRYRLRFPSTPAGPSCRFLINDLDEDGCLKGRCSLHGRAAKPLVCRLAPLSRVVDLTDGSEEWKEIPPVNGCPGWGADSPPEDGRSIDYPNPDAALREDLNGETSWFRELAAGIRG